MQTSLLQAQIFMLDFQAARWLMDGEVPKQAGNNHPTSIPTGVFKTADGYINIAATGQAIWERCCRGDRRARDLLTHPDYATGAGALEEPRRAQRRDRRSTRASAPAPHWIERAQRRPACPAGRSTRSTRCSPTPQVKHLGIAQDVPNAEDGQHPPGRPAGHAVAHAEQDGGAAAGARRAHRRGACASSASARQRSRS